MGLFPDSLVERIRAALTGETVLRRINYRPEMIQDAGDQLKCFCPIHKETIFRTLILDKRNGRYRCSNYNCPGNAGGDLIDLYARARDLSYEQALLELATVAGVDVDRAAVDEFLTHALEVASNYMEMGVLAEAEEQFQQVLRFNSDSVPALEGLARVYEMTDRPEEFQATRLRLARSREAAGDLTEAIELLKLYVRDNPADHDARRYFIDCLRRAGHVDWAAGESVNLADDLAAAGLVDDALSVYRAIGAQAVGGIDVSLHVIQLLLSAGRTAEAVAECIAQADARLAAGDPEAAAASLRAALEIDPAREDLIVRQAELVAAHKLGGEWFEEVCRRVEALLAAKAHGPAARTLEALDTAFPGRPLLLSLRADLEEARGNDQPALDLRLACIDALQQRREFSAALGVLEKTLTGRTDNVALLSRKANLLREIGRPADAVPVYLSIVELFKSADEYEHAAAVYQTVIDLEPEKIEHRERQLEFYLKLGLEPLVVQKALALADAWVARDRPERAAAVLARALEISAGALQLLSRHGEILEAAGRRGEAAEQFLALGRVLNEQFEWDRARQVLERALRNVPEHLVARELLADTLVSLELTLQAMSIYADLAEFHLRDGDADAVVRITAKVLRFQPDHMPTLLLMAKALQQLGQPERAHETQMRLVRLYMQGQSWTRATDLCEEVLGRQEDYIPAMEQLVAIAEARKHPTQSVAYLWRLSQVHARAGRRDQEQAVLEQVLAKDPAHVGAWFRHLELLAQWATPRQLEDAVLRFIDRMRAAGRDDDAVQLLRDLCQTATPKPEVFGGLARLHRLRGEDEPLRTALRTQAELLGKLLRDDEALAVWDQLAGLAPDDLAPLRIRIEIMMRNSMTAQMAGEYRRLARALSDRSRLEEAQVALLEVLNLAPADAAARDELITLYIRGGQHDRAAEQIEEAAARLLEENRLSEAITLYQRVFEFDPARVDAWRRIIAIRQRTGDTAGALEAYGKLLDALDASGDAGTFEQAAIEALTLDPDAHPFRERLAALYADQGRRPEAESLLLALAVRRLEAGDLGPAEAALDRLLELNPDSVPARAHRAELLARLGRADDALAEFRRLAGAISANPGSLAGGGGDLTRPFALTNYEGIRLVKDYTFETFVVGGRNNFAHATALAVSRAPARSYNPLFLYSDVGLGKTHLCHAIAHYLVDRHPELKILYTAAEDFVTDLIEAIQTNSVASVRNRFKLTDILILDDVQFLSGKERAQEEFFHIFNGLYQAGKQIVLTSDRPPRDIAHLERRLRSRFGAGIIVDIQSPDLETRIAILRHELHQRGKDGAVDDRVLLFIAEQVESNVRELKGALNQILARQDFSGEQMDLGLTREILARNLAGA